MVQCSACQCIADFGFKCLEDRRHAALRLCVQLSLLGFVAAFVGMLGGFAGQGPILKAFAWAKFYGPQGDYHTGVRFICGGRPGSETCTKWADMDCGNRGSLRNQCEVCKEQTLTMVVPIVVTIVTYLSFAHNTWKRYTGRDSTFVKIMSCFACFFAGTNFLLVLVAFWNSCVAIRRDEDDRAHRQEEASMGLGLLLMGLGAAGFKYVCGVLHLGLPVQDPSANKLMVDDSDSETSDADDSEGREE